MYELDLKRTRVTLVKAVRLVVAVRNMLRPMGLEFVEVIDLEREFREEAGVVQQVEEFLKKGDCVTLKRG